MDVNVVGGITLPKGSDIAAIIHTKYNLMYLRMRLKKGRSSTFLLIINANFLILRPMLVNFLSTMKKKTRTIQ